jgi:molybdopterin/thiamine biosynthesis adenylyltransferase
MALSDEERERYARHLPLPGLDEAAYAKLKAASVLVVGAGGLGSPALYYLAAAGVGRLGIVDSDVVELSNLQRQILHTTNDLGRPKTTSAAEKLRALNPHVEVVEHVERFLASSAFRLVDGYDVVVNAVDNFPTRFLVNDACVLRRKTLCEGGILGYVGVAMTIRPGETACYRCLFPETIRPEDAPTPAEEGVFGPVPGLIGSVQAAEAIKVIAGIGRPLFDRLLQYDALSLEFDEVEVRRDPACPVCGDRPTITELREQD